MNFDELQKKYENYVIKIYKFEDNEIKLSEEMTNKEFCGASTLVWHYFNVYDKVYENSGTYILINKDNEIITLLQVQ